MTACHKAAAASQYCWETVVKYVLHTLISSQRKAVSTWNVTYGLTVRCCLCHRVLTSLLLHHRIWAIWCCSQNHGSWGYGNRSS